MPFLPGRRDSGQRMDLDRRTRSLNAQLRLLSSAERGSLLDLVRRCDGEGGIHGPAVVLVERLFFTRYLVDTHRLSEEIDVDIPVAYG